MSNVIPGVPRNWKKKSVGPEPLKVTLPSAPGVVCPGPAALTVQRTGLRRRGLPSPQRPDDGHNHGGSPRAGHFFLSVWAEVGARLGQLHERDPAWRGRHSLSLAPQSITFFNV